MNTEELKIYHKDWQRKYRAKNRESYRDYQRKRSGTGDTEQEYHFYGYKEPLKSFSGGYGYEGVLIYNKENDKVQCHFCGKFFRFLNNSHLHKCHQLTAREYKQRAGLSSTTALCGEGTREKLINREHLKLNLKERMRFLKKAQTIRKRHPKRSLEWRNKRGVCPDQLLDLIKKTKEVYPNTEGVAIEDFVRLYGWGKFGSVRLTFGSWKNACKRLNLISSGEYHKKKYSTNNLLKYLKDFYKIHNRKPVWSDFNRGLLPSCSTYCNKFGGIRVANELAGLK